MTIGQALKKRREELGLSARQVVEAMGYPKSTGFDRTYLNRIERGVNSPRWNTVKMLAKVLGPELLRYAMEGDE